MKEILAALDLETIPQISLGTAALLIFAACALLAMLRGFLRMLLGSLVLCASGFVAYGTWRHTPAIAGNLGGAETPWISVAAPLVAGFATLLVLRLVMRFIARPAGKNGSEIAAENRRSPVRWAFTLLFSLIPAAVLWFSGATALRNIGSVAEIRRFVDGEEGSSTRSVFLAELKSAIDRALPQDWFEKVDPLSDEARVTLAKLIALGDASPPPKAIPVMEEPELRSLIANDPGLRELARAGRYADILRDPRLDHVMANPDLRRLLSNLRL
jgi:hypothetical protein